MVAAMATLLSLIYEDELTICCNFQLNLALHAIVDVRLCIRKLNSHRVIKPNCTVLTKLEMENIQ